MEKRRIVEERQKIKNERKRKYKEGERERTQREGEEVRPESGASRTATHFQSQERNKCQLRSGGRQGASWSCAASCALSTARAIEASCAAA